MVPPASRRPPPPGSAFSERIRARSVGGASLAVALSAVLHVALLLVLPFALQLTTSDPRRLYAPEWLIELARPIGVERFIELEAPRPRVAEAEPAVAPAVVELPSLIEPAPELTAPAPGPEPTPSALAGGEPAIEPVAGSEPGERGGAGLVGPLTAAERLRPGEKDPRLWFILPEEIVGLSSDQRMQLEIALAIAGINDSTAAAAAAARGFTDWTYTDDEGRRWGFSPGQLHLGELTIPLPFGFEAPPNSVAARRTRENAEIAAQAGRQEVRQSLRDRAAEIRRRRDAERARARGDTSSVVRR